MWCKFFPAWDLPFRKITIHNLIVQNKQENAHFHHFSLKESKDWCSSILSCVVGTWLSLLSQILPGRIRLPFMCMCYEVSIPVLHIYWRFLFLLLIYQETVLFFFFFFLHCNYQNYTKKAQQKALQWKHYKFCLMTWRVCWCGVLPNLTEFDVLLHALAHHNSLFLTSHVLKRNNRNHK